MSSAATPPSTATPLTATTSTPQPFAEGIQITSPSGKSYVIDEVIYQRPRGKRLHCLYRARFSLWCFSSEGKQKDILRDALAGLADLHDKGICHTDIKPAIMMDSFQQSDGTIGFRNVQITDLEDAVVLPPGSPGLTKRLSGNQFWRSPEAWARGVQNTPSDIFSFGITAIYVWLNRMAFFSDEANAADDASEMILQRQISHFTDDVEEFGGFIEYHGGEQDPFVQRCIQLLVEFDGKKKKRAPFGRWHPVDPEFKDLVSRMTCFNPLRRITATEALQHPWFRT
ncbi:predicted protein [Chaetomium globosum CBS 148.51]|uniref:Protein kinase domain-containing protein n=1 Tax=Chaetomium globosum (strain ATCC 6205 / CBS 148.51 / DSM 1962 / NBRC 6347 / NRRL 1970) TaxID=306901 RepID=Q2GM44_CHAGB|nr:uncharacterized protein CHGG_10960 [Chaetomium globosum CBS 148.51]EAQ83142.1 predicted protein [Chaetomium globosum CBS 148.51]